MRALSDELLSRAQSGDRSARDEIFESNTGLIWACVRKYAGVIEKDDLYQMGSIGLLKAIERFDPSYGVAFSTFAVPHILGEVRRHLRDNALVKVDRRLRDIAFRVNRVRERLSAQTGSEPPVSLIAKEMDLPVDVVLEAMEAAASVVYLEDVPVHRESPVPAERLGADESIDLRDALCRLDPQMRAVVEGRFFGGKTQQEVSRELGVSQAHVSRLEKKAIRAMREYYRGR